MKNWIVAIALMLPTVAVGFEYPALSLDILDPAEKLVGRARIFPNFIELFDNAGKKMGVIGIVWVQGRTRLFVVRSDRKRTLVGWAEGHRLYDNKGILVGYYDWTPIWSYVFDKKMARLGKAQCLAYQGVCAAGVAAYLLKLY